MIELFIDGQLVDLNDSSKVALTFQINNIGDLVSRQANFSKVFELPKTEHNNLIFGGSNDFSNTTDVPYTRLPAKIVQDGIEILPTGVAELQEVSNAYQVSIISDYIDFNEALGKSKLNDLDLYDIRLDDTEEVIAANMNNTSGTVYPIIDYGQLPATGRTIDLERDLFPAVYVHTIIDKIFEESGFNVEGDFLTDPQYLSLILPFTNKSIVKVVESKRGTRSSVVGSTQVITPTTSNPINGTYVPLNQVTFDTQTENQNGITYDFAGQYFTNWGSLVVHYDIFTIEITNTNASPGYVQVTSNGTDLVGYALVPANKTTTVEVRGTSPNITSGAQITLFIDALTTGFTINSITWQTGEVDQYVAQNLPDIEQKKLINNIAQMFGLVFDTNPYTNTIRIRRFDELLTNLPLAIDWSDKIETSDSISYKIDGYGQTNNLDYKEDDAVLTETGRGIIESNNMQLPLLADKADMAFAASESGIVFDALQVAEVIKYDSSNVFNVSVEPRILAASQQIITPAIDYGSGTVTNIVVGSFSGLSFEDLIADNYNVISLILQNSKKLDVNIKLGAADVANLDFLVPVYIRKYGAYFYINKIIDYLPNKTTTVELVKIQ